MNNDLCHQSRGLTMVAYNGLAIAGLTAMVLVAGATTGPHSELVSKLPPASARETGAREAGAREAGAREAGAKGSRQHKPASGTRAESARVASRLLGVAVIWYPPRPTAGQRTASHYDAVTIDAWIYGKSLHHARRTFRQQAIIDKLTGVLNSEPASPGRFVNCPAEPVTYRLTFRPVRRQPKTAVVADGCRDNGVIAGGHRQPSLADDGKVESIAKHLTRRRNGKAAR